MYSLLTKGWFIWSSEVSNRLLLVLQFLLMQVATLTLVLQINTEGFGLVLDQTQLVGSEFGIFGGFRESRGFW